MILEAIQYYLLAAIIVSTILLALKKKLGYIFWISEITILSPLFGLIIYSGFLLLLEISREKRLNNIEISEKIKKQIASLPQKGAKSILISTEDTVCVFNSNDLRLAIKNRTPETLENLSPDDFPAEDGLWYVLFFKEKTLTRLYGFESWHGENNCYK